MIKAIVLFSLTVMYIGLRYFGCIEITPRLSQILMDIAALGIAALNCAEILRRIG